MASCGFGYLAMAGLVGAATPDLTPRPPRLTARAKRVIFLCMSGGPAQLDTFDYKPQVGQKPHAVTAWGDAAIVVPHALWLVYGDTRVIERHYDDLARFTWARIPHFFSTPYYVYQYATCFASSAQLMKELTGGPSADRPAAIDRYLRLLKSGGSDHPMALLKRAGVDLSEPETVRAVVDQLDALVTKLEDAIGAVT